LLLPLYHAILALKQSGKQEFTLREGIHLEMPFSKFSKIKIIGCILFYFILFLAGDLVSSVLFDLLFSIVELPIKSIYYLLRALGCLVLTYLLFWLFTTRALHLKMKGFRISFCIRNWAVLYAVLLASFVIAAFLIIGEAAATQLDSEEIAFAVLESAVAALKAGVLEEMLFRGYIMKLLEEGWNKTLAILLPSFLFSLAHIPSMEVFSIVGVLLLVASGTLAGMMFSLVAYKGDSISNSSFIHAIWNFTFVTSILHITTAQGSYGEPVFAIVIPSDNVLLTGAGFGMEASIIAIIGYLSICCAATLKRGK